ncbi:MAG: PEGA domain-containing protein [Deltaproteobacteria bacterium]|nr:PEGA domain-containing protein [Deltaproteobacteria bacterium]
MKRFLLAGVGAVALALLSGCYPKGQIYGVGNEGGLIFAVNPPDAEVVLDGVIQGKASDFPEERYLKVESGKHALELRAPGFETYRREVYLSNSLLRIEKTLVRKK